LFLSTCALLGRALAFGSTHCQIMGKSRNQRSKHEATFLENVQDVLRSLHEEVVVVKMHIEEMRRQSCFIAACDSTLAYHPIAHGTRWADPGQWQDLATRQQFYTDDSQQSWRALAEEFLPASHVSLDRRTLLSYRQVVQDEQDALPNDLSITSVPTMQLEMHSDSDGQDSQAAGANEDDELAAMTESLQQAFGSLHEWSTEKIWHMIGSSIESYWHQRGSLTGEAEPLSGEWLEAAFLRIVQVMGPLLKEDQVESIAIYWDSIDRSSLDSISTSTSPMSKFLASFRAVVPSGSRQAGEQAVTDTNDDNSPAALFRMASFQLAPITHRGMAETANKASKRRTKHKRR